MARFWRCGYLARAPLATLRVWAAWQLRCRGHFWAHARRNPGDEIVFLVNALLAKLLELGTAAGHGELIQVRFCWSCSAGEFANELDGSLGRIISILPAFHQRAIYCQFFGFKPPSSDGKRL